jgi:hypothetical protein
MENINCAFCLKAKLHEPFGYYILGSEKIYYCSKECKSNIDIISYIGKRYKSLAKCKECKRKSLKRLCYKHLNRYYCDNCKHILARKTEKETITIKYRSVLSYYKNPEKSI